MTLWLARVLFFTGILALPVTGRTQSGWSIAIHGGAGTIPLTTPDSVSQQYYQSLFRALETGRALLQKGLPAIEVAEAVVMVMEDDPLFNAGRGSVFTSAGTHELDAAIMDGRTLACGSVAGVTTIRNPIRLARYVMEKTPHVFFAGNGLKALADSSGLEQVAPSWFDTPRRLKQYLSWKDLQKGTVGCVVRDQKRNLAAATSTGGTTGKRPGRVGDVPVIGAGTFADNRTAAISCTGLGEQFIRHTVARSVTARMEWGGQSLQSAADSVVFGVLNPGDGGLVAVSREGTIVFSFNSTGMFRGAATSEGRFEAGIWKEMISPADRPAHQKEKQ
ncbi:MAG: isoaspartyl peptidase/L-asparaginase [Bacteroidetes bacterium]|nr:isoaspartyl peptidase/L-asparaginase [Bacteroidota bacterium]